MIERALKIKKVEARPYIGTKYVLERGKIQSEIQNAIDAYRAAWEERSYSPVGRLGNVGKTKSRSVKFPVSWLGNTLGFCLNNSITFSELCNEALEWREKCRESNK